MIFSILLQVSKMRRRPFRVRGLYLLGVGTLVTIVFYFTYPSRVSRENVTVKNDIYAEGNDAAESTPDLNRYIVSNGIPTKIRKSTGLNVVYNGQFLMCQ
jgi:hypothetical protein